MQGELKQFDFNGAEVRVVMRGDEPWFVGSDVCKAMGVANHRDAIATLDSDEKDGVGIPDAIGRDQITTCVSESGVYHLALTRRTEKAQPFRRWVTHEVLPALRRTGQYSVADAPPAGMREQRVNAIVGAGRVFATINKVARAAGVTKKQAAELANEAGVREAGIDLFEIGQIERHVPDVPSGTAITRDPWYEALAEWAEGCTMANAAEATGYLTGKRNHSRADLARVGHMLSLLGFTQRIQKREKGRRVWYRVRPATPPAMLDAS